MNHSNHIIASAIAVVVSLHEVHHTAIIAFDTHTEVRSTELEGTIYGCLLLHNERPNKGTALRECVSSQLERDHATSEKRRQRSGSGLRCTEAHRFNPQSIGTEDNINCRRRVAPICIGNSW